MQLALLLVHSEAVDKEYIQSGRFIHDELLRRCEPLTAKVIQQFRRDKTIRPTLLLWPTDSVKASDGNLFSGVLFTELPESGDARKKEIRDAIIRSNAFAALVTEQVDNTVRLIFESEHGTRTWRLPIRDYGGVQVLERTAPRDNAESIGVLWQAN